MHKVLHLLIVFSISFTSCFHVQAQTIPDPINDFTDIVITGGGTGGTGGAGGTGGVNIPGEPGIPGLPGSGPTLTIDLGLGDLNGTLGNINDFFENAGGALDNLQDVFGAIDGILDGSFFNDLIENAIGDFSLFGLDPIPSVGVAAALGMVAVPVVANLINKAIEGILKLVAAGLEALWKLIRHGSMKRQEYMKAFKDAKKHWLKLKKLGAELDQRLIQSIKLHFTIQKIKENSNYVMKNGYRLALQGLLFNLQGIERKLNRQLDEALDNSLADEAQKISQAGAKVSILIEDAKEIKEKFPEDLDEKNLCKKLKADYNAILMTEGELQKARGHILGARDYWQDEWNKENKKIDKKFRRVKFKARRFYKKSISMATKGKRKALRRLKKLKNKIPTEEYAEKEALILETYTRTVEKARKDREVELQKAKQLYLDFNAQFGEYEGYTRWFSDLINTQVSLTKRFSALMNMEDQIENICTLVGSEYY